MDLAQDFEAQIPAFYKKICGIACDFCYILKFLKLSKSYSAFHEKLIKECNSNEDGSMTTGILIRTYSMKTGQSAGIR